MLNEIEVNLHSHLKKGKICTLYNFTQRFPNVSPTKIVEIFVNFYKSDMALSLQLLCHIVISKDEGMRIQLQKFSNIQKGMVLNYTSSMEPLTFQKQNVKQLKIIAIFPKYLSMYEVKKGIEFPETAKTTKYVNKFLLTPIIKINKDITTIENQYKKEQPKKESIKTQIKQPIKHAKTDEKINPVKKQTIQPKTQLPRVSNKEQKPTPILTEFIAIRTKVQNMKAKVEEQKIKNKHKMAIQSDEELYTKQGFAKLMEKEPERDTDNSGKKSHTEESQKKPEPMDIQNDKPIIQTEKHFIDDDDDADDVFKQIQLVEHKKMEQPQPQPSKIKDTIITEKPKPKNVQPMKAKQSNKPSEPKSTNGMYAMFNFLPRPKKNC